MGSSQSKPTISGGQTDPMAAGTTSTEPSTSSQRNRRLVCRNAASEIQTRGPIEGVGISVDDAPSADGTGLSEFSTSSRRNRRLVRRNAPSEGTTSSDPETRQRFECVFSTKGCNKEFETMEDEQRHQQSCVFGLMHLCQFHECEHLPIFENQTDLLDHASAMHGCQTETSPGMLVLKCTIPAGFLSPANDEGINASFLQRYQLKVGNDDISVALAAIARKQEVQPEFLLAPIRIGLVENDHFLRYKFCLSTDDHQKLVHFMDDRRLAYAEDCTELMQNGFATQAFKSDVHFFHQINSEKVPRYLEGINRLTFIETTVEVYPCVIDRVGGAFPVRYGNYWVDLLIGENLRAKMIDGGLPNPSPCTSIICPQIQSGIDAMVESSDQDGCMNAIFASIFNVIIHDKTTEVGGMRSCAALVLVPPGKIEGFVAYFRSLAEHLDLTFFPWKADPTKSFLLYLASGGADVIVMSYSDIELACHTSNIYQMKLILKHLGFLHLYDPNSLIVSPCRNFIRNFLEQFEPEVLDGITKTSFGINIPFYVRKFLHDEIFRSEYLFIELN